MRKFLSPVLIALALALSVVACRSASTTPSPEQAPGAMQSASLDMAALPGITRSQTSVQWRFQIGLCMDDGQNLVRAWPCNGSEPQSFWGVNTVKGNGLYLIGENGKECIDEPSSKVWSAVIDGPCSLKYLRERWALDYSNESGWYLLRNEVSGLCLQDPYDLYEHQLSVYPCTSGKAERVFPYSNGTPI